MKIAIVRVYVRDTGRYTQVHPTQRKPRKHKGFLVVYLRDPRCTKVHPPSRIPT